MKRLQLLLTGFAVLGAMSYTRTDAQAADSSKAKVIGYYMDASDDYYKAGFQVFKALANNVGWQVLDVVGQGTAPEQIDAVENFITQKVDAIVVVQNSPETTSETLKRAHAAGIPEFHLTHNPPNEPGLAGFAGFDWVYDGELAAQSALKHNVKNLIMIEGKLGQGTAAGQTQGFLQGYKKAGKDVGNLLDSVGVKGAGGKDLQVVFWGQFGACPLWRLSCGQPTIQRAIICRRDFLPRPRASVHSPGTQCSVRLRQPTWFTTIGS
jgi:galactofuranose transport system substrate-binding protein